MFLEDAKTLPESNTTTPKEPVPKTVEKNKKEGKNEDTFVNLHPSENMKHESALMRKIEHGAEILLKNIKYITPVTFEFALTRKKNQINLFESHKKVFTTMKMMDNTTPIITKKSLNILTYFLKDKNILIISPPTMKYKDREKYSYAVKWNHP